MPVIDPATGEQVATAAAGSAADVERAVRSARAAFDDGRWRYLAPLEQERRLRRLAALIVEHGDELAELDVIDSGLLRFYAGFIVQFAADGIEYYSGWPSKLHGSIPAVPHEFAVYQVREPLGVVGAIMPWNGPTAAAAMATFPLCAGNSVVLKPAEQTPMTAVLHRRARARGGHPAGRVQRRPGHRRDRRRGARRPSGGRRDHVHRLERDRAGDPGRRRGAGEAREPRARRQEPVDHLPGRRPGGGLSGGDGRRVGRVGPGLHVRHARAGPRERLRRGRRARSSSESRGLRIGGGFDPDAEMGPVVSADAARARSSATCGSARTRAPSWRSAERATATAATSTSRPSSPAFATT